MTDTDPETKHTKPVDRFIRQAVLIEIIDGDTLDVQIDLGWSMKLKERIRLARIDTPEITGKTEKEAGLWVKNQVGEFFGAKDGQIPENTRLIITSRKYDRTGKLRDHYCRTVAEVYRADDRESLNDYLISKKLGWKADIDGKLSEERTLSSLTGLPAELRE